MSNPVITGLLNVPSRTSPVNVIGMEEEAAGFLINTPSPGAIVPVAAVGGVAAQKVGVTLLRMS
jgi:hypothetical protein